MPDFFELIKPKKQPPGISVPDVIVDFIFEKGLFFIAVENIGVQPAYNISVAFNKQITGTQAPEKEKVSDINLFKDISFMPPGKQIRTFVDTSEAYFARKEPTKIITRITFKDNSGRVFRNKIRHNLEIYRDIGYIATR